MKNKIIDFTKKYLFITDKNILFFAILYLIMVLQNIVFELEYLRLPRTILLGEFYVAYILTLGKQWLSQNKIAQYVYLTIINLWVLCFYLIDFYCLNTLNTCFTIDVANVILSTNPEESSEFLQLYFGQMATMKGFVSFGGLILLILIYIFFRKKKVHVHNWIKLGLLACSIACLLITALFATNTQHFAYNLFTKTSMFFRVESAPNLRDYLTHPQLNSNEEDLSRNIVFIIGESSAKYHSSLYGYEKETNPRIAALRDSKHLFVFDSITSPGVTTITSFQYFMSNYSHANQKEQPWYTHTTIPEIFHTLGYHIVWISNQKKKGLVDNIITKYSELCDTAYFCAGDVEAIHKDYYDENVVDKFDELPFDSTRKNFFIFHLMGSHASFERRYPKSFVYYTAKDYPDALEHQRATLAHYDNSLRYNDYVLTEIIKRFEDKEALVLYFSDHGIDVFKTDPNYAAHAKDTPESKKISMQIPFFIYTSPLYEERHPKQVERIRQHIHTTFCTENTPYMLMDLSGANYRANDDVKKYSPFCQ